MPEEATLNLLVIGALVPCLFSIVNRAENPLLHKYLVAKCMCIFVAFSLKVRYYHSTLILNFALDFALHSFVTITMFNKED